ncbi:acyloxyacyl hydrolase [Microbulbifer sp. SAOS-129_SWC]|uniref:acyloxyacyl hydrolase n=1 Tax=Microbulbifer sp. SAOS-129_SWC TaxID=3145235 RepID=UPI003217268E
MAKIKLKPALFVVAVFVALVICAMHAESTNAGEPPGGPFLSLGHTALHSDNSVGEIGYRVGHWEAAAALIGQGHTSRGDIERARAWSVSRIVWPSWQLLGADNYYRIGAAYVDGDPLVGDWNYRLGLGLSWGLAEVEYFHYSSAGINDPNTGIDGVQLRLRL